MRAFATKFPTHDPCGNKSIISGEDVRLALAVQRDVLWLEPADPASVARERLLERAAPVALVVGANGDPIGSLTPSDLLAAGELAGMTVGDVMTNFVFTLPVSATLGQAAALMAYEGIGHCAVIDGDGCAIGVVTTADVALWMGGAAGYVALLGNRFERQRPRVV